MHNIILRLLPLISLFGYSNAINNQLAFVSTSRQWSSPPHGASSTSSSTSCLAASARYDNLVGGLAQISIGASLCVLWSEYSVVSTGCGPLQLSDVLERCCYQLDIFAAGAFWWTRLALQNDLKTILTRDDYDWFRGFSLEEFTLVQVSVAEWMAYLTVAGAIVALAAQVSVGANMDGLSGIDVEQCRAMQGIKSLY